MSDSQNYLKNLSQKKYAWIEEATAAAAAASTPQKPTDQTNEQNIPSLESLKSRKKPRPNNESISSPSILSTTEEPNEQEDKTASKKKFQTPSTISQPSFKYTTFPIKGYTILPTRNITSTFVKSDTTFVRGHKAGDEAICPHVKYNRNKKYQ